MIHIYYGYGKGKTCSAVGAGMRAYGAGLSVLLVQFLKNNQSSELKTLPFDIYDSPEYLPFNPDNSYKLWVNSAVEYIKNSSADMIILDEFLDTADKFISTQDALKLIKELKCEVIITGHCENEKFFEAADYITAFDKIKHPFDNGVKAREGVEY